MGKTKVNLDGANAEKDVTAEELPKKKNKKSKEPRDEVNHSDDFEDNHKTKRKKGKPLTKNKSQEKERQPKIDCDPEENVAQDFGSMLSKNKSKKKKEELQKGLEPTDDDMNLRIKRDKKEQKKKSNNIVNHTFNLSSVDKKIVLIDNGPVTASVSTNIPKKSVKFSKKQFNEDEEEVKEEDIDQFCDEITEEDNEQYENWIKLLEAKLGSNKKSNN